MRMYKDLKEMLCKELDEITRKGELSAGTLDTVDKLTHAIKSIETIMAMEESGYSRENGGGGMSNRGRSYDGRSYEGGSYDDRPYYEGSGGMSNARGRGRNARRDSMGRYASNDGYSYADAKEDMMTELRDLMQDAPDEETRKEFKRFMNKLSDMR